MRMLVLCVSLSFVCQAQTPAVKMSAAPLDAEQIAVYHAFLAHYMQGPPASINLAEVTSSFAPDKGDFAGCMKGFSGSRPLVEVHSLKEAFAGNKSVKLVDPSKHAFQDPEDGMRQGQSVDDAVNRGFAAALMTVSEIMFDASHTHAALNYSFHCGRLCGNGGTVVYELRGGKWVRSKRSCGSWVS